MKIAVYGISRVGKDYLIDSLVNRYPNDFIHIKGSLELNKLSKHKYNLDFSKLSEDKQREIRKDFIISLDAYEEIYRNVVVDGHYSFPTENGYKVVFDKSDYNAYNAIFYLNKSIETIKRQVLLCKKNDKINDFLLFEDNSLKWEEFEILEMQKIYDNSNKDLYILYECFNDCIEFIYKYVNENFSSRNITNRIHLYLAEKTKGIQNVVLSDLDKTLSINDASYDYMYKGNLKREIVKEIFSNEYYTGYQQYRFHKYMKEAENIDSALNYGERKCLINTELVNKIRKEQPVKTIVIGITTGLADIWHRVNKKYKICDFIIGYSYHNWNINELITKKVKGEIAKELTNEGVNTIALGDSIVDFPMMLNSNKSYLICNSNLNKSVNKNLSMLIGKNIFQLSINNEKYNKIVIKENIW